MSGERFDSQYSTNPIREAPEGTVAARDVENTRREGREITEAIMDGLRVDMAAESEVCAQYVLDEIASSVPEGHGIGLDDRVRAVALYSVYGRCGKVAKETGISYRSLLNWHKEDWFQNALQGIRRYQNENFVARIAQIQNLALDEIEDRLIHGDEIYSPKADKTVKVAMRGKDAAMTFGIMADKRQVYLNQPTSISGSSGGDKMQRLLDKFEEISRQAEMKTIEGECEVMSDPQNPGKGDPPDPTQPQPEPDSPIQPPGDQNPVEPPPKGDDAN